MGEMSKAGICIGGLAAGQFHNSKSTHLEVVVRPPMSVDQFMKASPDRMLEGGIEHYTWARFGFKDERGYTRYWNYWRHDSIILDGDVLDALFNAYRPVPRT